MRKTILIAALAFLSPSQFAQPAADLGPRLLATDAKNKPKPLALSKADVRVVLVGPVAETTLILTYHNDTNRQLEGELSLPLPEGATVTGFGLDVNGELVDGVPVERELARITYESESRKRIDPGVIEQTVGNNFRTRIYPIPAKGQRTVKVQYVSDASSTYRLPMAWAADLPDKDCNVRIEVNEPGATASGSIGSEPLKFETRGGKLVAESKRYGDVAVTLAGQSDHQVMIESRQRPLTMQELEEHAKKDQGEYYFLVSDKPQAEAIRKLVALPTHVGILWDASLSRLLADKTRELAFLKKSLSSLDPGASIDVILFRDKPQAPKIFSVDQADALIKYLTDATYDGGTNLSLLSFPKTSTTEATRPYDFWLFFTDGLADLGPNKLKDPEIPVYPVTFDPQSNHALLRAFADKSGGAYLNLERLSDDQAKAELSGHPLMLLGVDHDESQVTDLYPRGPQPVTTDRLLLSGKLLVPEAKISLKYGRDGVVTQRVDLTLKRDAATNTGIVPRFWAEQKVAELSIDPVANAQSILAVGKSFSLVTPNTSLLVLETAQQYIDHGIVPPQSRKDVYAEFLKGIEQRHVNEKQTQQQRLDYVLNLWNARVKWWEQKFEYPAKFTYRGENENHAATTQSAAVATALPSQTREETADLSLQANLGGLAGNGLASRGAAAAPAAKALGGQQGEIGPSIAIKPWDPNVPYLLALREAGPTGAYAAYLKNRPNYVASPAFYLDCADYLLNHDQREMGIRVLTSAAELKLESAPLLRVVAHRLEQIGETDLAIELFEKIKAMRSDEPQSWRDLALALSTRAQNRIRAAEISCSGVGLQEAYQAAVADYSRSLVLFNHILFEQSDARFPEIELPVLMEANGIIAALDRRPRNREIPIPLDSRLVKNLDCDLRVVLTWDADLTDVDLWVTEPSGETCIYSHNRTAIGGLLSHDFTQGYGPEEYCLHQMMPGTYKTQCHYYGSSQSSMIGPVTVQATVITHFGRADETRKTLTVRLDKPKDLVDLGEVKLEK
jgi:hypothetical protein